MAAEQPPGLDLSPSPARCPTPRSRDAPSCSPMALEVAGTVGWVLATRTCPDISGEFLLLLASGATGLCRTLIYFTLFQETQPRSSLDQLSVSEVKD